MLYVPCRYYRAFCQRCGGGSHYFADVVSYPGRHMEDTLFKHCRHARVWVGIFTLTQRDVGFLE